MWMEFECEASFVAEPPLPRQHFFQFCGVIALGFIGCAELWQAFFQFLNHGLHGLHGFQNPHGSRKRAAGTFRSRLRWRAINYRLSPVSQRHGRGAGVGRGLGEGVDLGAAVAVGVAVAVAVRCSGCAVAVGVGEGDAQGLTGQVKISIESKTVTPSDRVTA